MAGKENPDLFSRLSSNDGTLPLDFDKNTRVAEPSKKQTEKKSETSESSSIKSHPVVEKGESQRRPTHHIPPPYKKTAHETAPLEPKNDIETNSAVVIQEKPVEKTEVIEIPVQPQASVPPAPIIPVLPPSVPIVAPPSPAFAHVEKTTAPEPPSKRIRHSKEPQPASTPAVAVEKKVVPASPVQTGTKPQLPDVKQQEVKSSGIIPNTESSKPAKKSAAIEKLSTANPTAGQLLQEGRVKAGFSTDQVAISTKIKKPFIECMERDDFENLPASVYISAYTRALCSLYNIDDKLVLSMLRKAKGKNLDHHVPEEVILQLEKGKQVNIVQENKIKRIMLIGFAACLTVVACVLTTYYFIHERGGKPSAPDTAPKPNITPVLPVKPVLATGISAKTLEEDMEKKLMAPHVFTMTSLPLAER
jgi:hypothetical protein